MRRGFGGFAHTNNKYGARKVIFKGIKFDSTYERDRYICLLHLQREGKISGLRLQQEFILIPQLTKLVPKQLKTKVRYDKRVVEQDSRYTCDFIYIENGVYVMEEFKSEMTSKLADYIIRRKLMVAKIYEHNKKGRGQWLFREVVYSIDKKKQQHTTITDK